MKHGKAALALLLAGCCALAAGCSARRAVSAEEFTAAAEDAGFTVTQEAEGPSVMLEKDGATITFVECGSSSAANQVYSGQRETLQSTAESGGGTPRTLDSDTYRHYFVTVGDFYYALVQNGGTVCFVEAAATDQETVESLLREVGYLS